MELMTRTEWVQYRNLLSRINSHAVEEFKRLSLKIVTRNGVASILEAPRNEIIDLANAILMKYGDAAATAACDMHEAMAALSGVKIPPAEPASFYDIHDVAKIVNGAAKSGNEEIVAGAVGRMVKQAGQDTTAYNAIRDGAEWAWVPSGETCAFCIALAANGWHRASKKQLKDGHCEHIHENCDCAFAVRFSEDETIGGYNPARYKSMYDKADGNSAQQKINSMRREFYAENSDKINEQKRDAYEKQKERESSEAEEKNV